MILAKQSFLASKVRNVIVSRWAIPAICLIVLSGILVAALWPFHSPQNQVTWAGNENALHFGRYSTALSSGILALTTPDRPSFSVELWIEPDLTWTTGTILSFYRSSNNTLLSVRQNYTDLVLQYSDKSRVAEVSVDDVFRKPRAFVAITSNAQHTAVYIDGQLAQQATSFWPASGNLSAQLVLGDSPLRSTSWRGQLRGLAIYKCELTSAQVARDYSAWAEGQASLLDENTNILALYLFDEHTGKIIRDRIKPGIDLYIPRRYRVVDHLLFEPPWSEFRTQSNYLKDGLLNVAGFVPLGYVLSLYFIGVRKAKWSELGIILFGACVSFTIELVQAYLPTRYSGITDIVTNTLGTAVGVALYRFTAAPLARLKAIYLRR